MTRLLAALLFFTAQVAFADESADRHLLIGDYTGKSLILYSQADGVVWSHKADGVYDCWMQADGTIVWAGYAGIQRLRPDIENGSGAEVLWTWQVGSGLEGEKPKCEVHSCQPTADSGVVTAEAGSDRLLTLDAQGRIVASHSLALDQKSPVHVRLRLVRSDGRGGQWIALLRAGKALHVNHKGEVLEEIDLPGANQAYEALPLPNGHLLVSTAATGRVIEYNADGDVHWSISGQDIAELKQSWIAGIERQHDGNTFVCLWRPQQGIIEVTPEKQVVWQLPKGIVKGPTRVQVLGADWRPVSTKSTTLSNR